MQIEEIKKILDINKEVFLTPQEMAENLIVTFYPTENKNQIIKDFTDNLKKTFIDLGVKVIPFQDSLAKLTLKERLKLKVPFYAKFGKKIKKGIAIIVEGESKTNNLAMRRLISLRENPIITIIQGPKEINSNSSYKEHMELSLNLFAYHMTNLVIMVNNQDFTIYSLNGSHPYFSKNENFKENILNELLPKISAPVMPPSLKDFIIEIGAFNINDNYYQPFIDDLIKGGALLKKTNLYPKKRLVSELNFRNNLYKLIGKKYLDNRNGMSYGFVARQLPTNLNKKIPDVWVITSKSGSDKSKLDKNKDIIKVGLVDGKMIIQTPVGVDIQGDYKPSFDTRVILAHAVGNAILAKEMNNRKLNWQFAENLEKNGMAIVHWHGYIKNKKLLGQALEYGLSNPSVSCSSPQSAVYALRDKLDCALKAINEKSEYNCEIHIEPHHGSNIIYESIISLANILLSNNNISKLE